MMKQINDSITNVADFIEKNYKIFFTLILILAISLNTYKLGKVPQQIHIDEAGMTYDAYCIANYGTDRFEKHMPVYFINFGGGQNALYTYLTAIIIKLSGSYNSTIIRIPALILSTIEVIVAFLLVKEFKSKKHALLFMLLVTIAPWHIMKSRWGLESYLLSPLFLFSIYALVIAIKSESKRVLKFIIAGALFGITLYTYAIAYIMIPIFLTGAGIYLFRKKKITIKELITFCVPLGMLAIPLILMLIVQKGWLNEINSFITIPKLFQYRSEEISLDIKHLKYLYSALFMDYLNYNSIPGFGVLYYFGSFLMIIGVVLGIIRVIKDRNKSELNLDLIMLLAFGANLIISLLVYVNANKLNGILISATYFEYVALREIYRNVKITFVFILMIYAVQFGQFISKYYTDFNEIPKHYSDNGEIELMAYLNQNYSEKTYYRKGSNGYIYNLYANPINPHDFNSTKIMKNETDVIGYKYYREWDENISEQYDDNGIYITTNETTARAMKENLECEIEVFKNYYILHKNNSSPDL